MLQIVPDRGCVSCIKPENMCREVVAGENPEATAEKVTKVEEFRKSGVMLSPALTVNGRVHAREGYRQKTLPFAGYCQQNKLDGTI